MATVKEFVRIGLPPRTHLYDNPDLSAVEFLLAVMHDTHQPMSYRVEAAKAALPYTNSFPSKVQGYVAYHCRIIIPPFEPRTPDHPPADDPTKNHSENLDFASKTLTHNLEAVTPLNIETTSNPPTPAEIAEIKAVIQRLRPDLVGSDLVGPDADLSNIPEPRLCACGHWMFYPCKCVSRDTSKMN
jgi:hypothetical protein